MALRKSKPTTSSRRGVVFVDRSDLWSGRPEKSLTQGLRSKGGRNNAGRITARRRGGGAKRLYRMVDFRRNRVNDPATVVRIEYDPGRTAFIALIQYGDGDLSYISCPAAYQARRCGRCRGQCGHQAGQYFALAQHASGNDCPLRGVEGRWRRQAGAGRRHLCAVCRPRWRLRSAAAYVGRDAGGTAGVQGYRGCRVPIPTTPTASLARPGCARNFGQRPEVRGVAMNPVDHPHGGGEGRTSGGRHPVTPWGKPTKGRRTRGSKPSDKLIIRSRHLRRRRRR